MIMGSMRPRVNKMIICDVTDANEFINHCFIVCTLQSRDDLLSSKAGREMVMYDHGGLT